MSYYINNNNNNTDTTTSSSTTTTTTLLRPTTTPTSTEFCAGGEAKKEEEDGGTAGAVRSFDGTSAAAAAASTKTLTTTMKMKIQNDTTMIQQLHHPNDTTDGMMMLSCPQCRITSTRNGKSPSTSKLYTDWTQGDIICCNCGLVLEESIRDETAEYNIYQDEKDATTSVAKQRTAGPVRPDGTLDSTTLSTLCYGGAKASSHDDRSSSNLRRRLIRIQHIRDRWIDQQQTKLVQSVEMDIAIRKRKLAEWVQQTKKKRKKKDTFTSIQKSDHQQNEEEEEEVYDEDEEDDYPYEVPTMVLDINYGSSTTTDVPPPRNMILIEEHLEAQIEKEQAQLDERKRLLNIKKWTLQKTTTIGPDHNDDDDDETSDNDNTTMIKRKRRKRTKLEIAEFERARMTLAKAAEILRSLAARKQQPQPNHSVMFTETMIDTTLQRFQWYGATNDKLPMAACAAIVHMTCGKLCLDAYGTTKLAVKKMTKQILAQFPNWNTLGRITNTPPTISSTTSSTKTTTTSTTTIANASTAGCCTTETVMALLDRLQQTTTSSNNNNTILRNATLVLRESLTTPASILAAVYFCSMVQYKLAQLGLTTTKTTSGTTTITTVPPVSVAQLAKQGGVPASRIKAAYQSADRIQWLDQVATVLPQAVMVGKVLPNRAV